MNEQSITVDPTEAPAGYYAVLKSQVKTEALGNICRACDWRPDCSGRTFRCMSFEVITPDGLRLKRNDGCSVVFKKLPRPETAQ